MIRIIAFAFATLAFVTFAAEAFAQRCPPGTRYYCEGSRCRCV